MNRKIILNLAISLDGFIADEDGGFDWIKGDCDISHDTEHKFDFSEFVDSVDILVMGMKAYKDCPSETLKTFSSKTIYVATHSKIESEYNNVKFISGDICDQILKLKEGEGKNVWIWGGAILADQFIKANVIDEYIIGIIPLILGKGRSLFLENNPTIRLHLYESTTQEGVVILKYSKRELL
ncbi:dihydrofolate reductase family protein [Patescibacteria group bacterium]|nr:dihydrofolate reductase family protein [Patescibacteria group bacterium]